MLGVYESLENWYIRYHCIPKMYISESQKDEGKESLKMTKPALRHLGLNTQYPVTDLNLTKRKKLSLWQ
jgi:hypothetical protein